MFYLERKKTILPRPFVIDFSGQIGAGVHGRRLFYERKGIEWLSEVEFYCRLTRRSLLSLSHAAVVQEVPFYSLAPESNFHLNYEEIESTMHVPNDFSTEAGSSCKLPVLLFDESELQPVESIRTVALKIARPKIQTHRLINWFNSFACVILTPPLTGRACFLD